MTPVFNAPARTRRERLRRTALVAVVASAPFFYSVRIGDPGRMPLAQPRRGSPAATLSRPAPPAAGDVGYMGILTGNASTELTSVMPASPAELAGLRAGDRVVAIDGVKVDSPPHLRALVRSRRAGDRVVVRVERDGEVLDVAVALGGPPRVTR